MKILLTGATGFIGRHVLPLLLEQGHQVTALVRDLDKARSLTEHEQLRLIQGDIHNISSAAFSDIGTQDAIMHLAWAGLPHYKAASHLRETLPENLYFLQTLIDLGIKQVLVTGTCLEYGMQEGCLSETMPTQPAVPYAIAKDTLRKSLESAQLHKPFILQWARLFYMYGDGQSPNSLLAQLEHTINTKNSTFNMSGGEQLRDYLPVEEVARRLCVLLAHPDCVGVINICNGTSISVRQLVENHLKKHSVSIELNFGVYPYPDYEPMAFWGDVKKFKDGCIND
jgi:nucleoside-diphosphate-sugar epimerase